MIWITIFFLGDNDSIIQSTPLKSLKEPYWVLNSPSGKWTVTPDDTGKQVIEKPIFTDIFQEEVESNNNISSPNTNLNTNNSGAVKRQLNFKENNVENSGTYHLCCLLSTRYLNF